MINTFIVVVLLAARTAQAFTPLSSRTAAAGTSIAKQSRWVKKQPEGTSVPPTTPFPSVLLT
jgi:hypothetical protein